MKYKYALFVLTNEEQPFIKPSTTGKYMALDMSTAKNTKLVFTEWCKQVVERLGKELK